MGGKGKGKGAPPPPKAMSAEDKEKARLESLEKQEKEKKEREEIQAQLKAINEASDALKGRLPAMKAFDIFGKIPWSSARTTVKLEGSGGKKGGAGVTVVDLDGEHAVCLRKVPEIVSEFMAEAVAVILKVPVARTRIVRPDDPEYTDMEEIMKRNPKEFMLTRDPMVKAFYDGDPTSPALLTILNTHGEEVFRNCIKGFGHRKSVAVLEFVPGSRLDAVPHSGPYLRGEAAWQEMGRICALDIVLNNMDRLPIPVFDNREGNLGNVMVGPSGVVAIDQQVNVVTNEQGMQTYLNRVSSFVRDIIAWNLDGVSTETYGQEHGSCTAIARIRSAFNTRGKELSDSASTNVLLGLQAGLKCVAENWGSGMLPAALDAAEVKAAQCIVESQKEWKDGTWSSPSFDNSGSATEAKSCADFIRKVAAAIDHAVGLFGDF